MQAPGVGGDCHACTSRKATRNKRVASDTAEEPGHLPPLSILPSPTLVDIINRLFGFLVFFLFLCFKFPLLGFEFANKE